MGTQASHLSLLPRHQYLVRHHEALQRPRGPEEAIVSFRGALLKYAVEYEARFEGIKLGDDALLGEAWLNIARSYLVLLNSDTGRLDCGTLDGEVRSWAERFGFSEAEMESL